MSTILVTGFSNFGKINNNPSEILVNLLKQKYADKIDTYIFKSYKDIDCNLTQLLNKSPKIVVMFGLASRTPYVRLEQIAKKPNNVSSSVEFYKNKLPLEKIYTELLKNNIAVAYSKDAGNYWCNYLFYKVSSLRNNKNHYSQGLIHIPQPNRYNKTNGDELNLLDFGSILINTLLK